MNREDTLAKLARIGYKLDQFPQGMLDAFCSQMGGSHLYAKYPLKRIQVIFHYFKEGWEAAQRRLDQ